MRGVFMMVRRVVVAGMFCVAAAMPAAAQDLKAKGEKLFVDQKCTLCHAIAGKGNAKGSLDEVGSKDSPADIRAWISDANAMTAKTGATRKPAMKQFALEKDDMDALVAYLSVMKKK